MALEHTPPKGTTYVLRRRDWHTPVPVSSLTHSLLLLRSSARSTLTSPSGFFFSEGWKNITHAELMSLFFFCTLFLPSVSVTCRPPMYEQQHYTLLPLLYTLSLLIFVNTFSHNASLPSLPFHKPFLVLFLSFLSSLPHLSPNKSISRLSLFFFFFLSTVLCRQLVIGYRSVFFCQRCRQKLFGYSELSPMVIWVQ